MLEDWLTAMIVVLLFKSHGNRRCINHREINMQNAVGKMYDRIVTYRAIQIVGIVSFRVLRNAWIRWRKEMKYGSFIFMVI